MFRRVSSFAAVLFAALMPAVGLAQTAGTVAGVVRDSLGGAIPGATVRVINEATGVAQEAVSDAEGRYRVDDLVPGPYRVEATLDGFESGVNRGALDGRQAASIDLTLTPARLTEGVVVTGYWLVRANEAGLSGPLSGTPCVMHRARVYLVGPADVRMNIVTESSRFVVEAASGDVLVETEPVDVRAAEVDCEPGTLGRA